MKYQVWESYSPGSGFAFAESVEGLSYDQETQILLGNQLPETLSNLKVANLSHGEQPDVLSTPWSGLIVSVRLRTILETFCSEEIQFLDISIQDFEEEKYYLINFLFHLSCLDRNLSDFDTFADSPDSIQTVRKMVLKPIPSEAPAAFILDDLAGVVLVKDDLRQAMQANSASPGVFIPVDKFQYGIIL